MIARHLAMLCLIYLALVLQTGMGRDFPGFGLPLWLPGIVLVICVRKIQGSACLVWAGLLGLGLDCQSLTPLGVHLATATIIASLLIWIQSDAGLQGLMATVMSIMGTTFVWQVSTALVHRFVDHQQRDIWQTIVSAGISAGNTTCLAAIVLVGAQAVWAIIRPRHAATVSLNNQWSMLTGK